MPDQIGARFGDTVTSEKSASGVSAFHLETLRVRMVRIDEPDIARQGCDVAIQGRTSCSRTPFITPNT